MVQLPGKAHGGARVLDDRPGAAQGASLQEGEVHCHAGKADASVVSNGYRRRPWPVTGHGALTLDLSHSTFPTARSGSF